MKVKVVRSLGRQLLAELDKAGLTCPEAQEGQECDVHEDVAKLLLEQKLAEIVVSGKIAPKGEGSK